MLKLPIFDGQQVLGDEPLLDFTHPDVHRNNYSRAQLLRKLQSVGSMMVYGWIVGRSWRFSVVNSAISSTVKKKRMPRSNVS